MARISKFGIRNVRCFNSMQWARMGRITLLVGENSVGKSTFLGCYNAFATLSNLIELTGNDPFDVSPFLMGPFDTIARSKASNFGIAGYYEDHIYSAAEFSYNRNNEGRPFEENVKLTFSRKNSPSTFINMFISDEGGKEKKILGFRGPNFSFDIDWADISFLPISTWLSRNAPQGFLPYNADRAIFEKRRGSQKDIAEFGKFVNFFRAQMPFPNRHCFNVCALEPNIPPRTRIYKDPPEYLRDAEGRERASDVGATLGLWESISLSKRTAEGDSQIFVKTNAGLHNLLDVGYGVHSLLPLVGAIENVNTPSIFLLQQPEVHVHPVAQAKLAQYMAEGPHDFVIETHSDHLVDRFRLCVLEEVLQPEDLKILYFEKDKNGYDSKIYNISVDSQGNILNPPDSYREFFLTETERLLGLNSMDK